MKEELISINQLKNDPVASGLIVAFITFIAGQIGTFIYNLIAKDFSFNTAYKSSTEYLSYRIELKWILITLLAILIIYFLQKFIRQKLSKNPYKEIDSKFKIGDYKAGELFNILLTTDMDTPSSIAMHGIREMNLIQLFILFQPKFNMGIEWEHPGEEGHFMYYILGPKLMSYGILEKKTRKVRYSSKENEEEEIIQTSENGYKLTSFIEKTRLYTQVYPNEEKSKSKE